MGADMGRGESSTTHQGTGLWLSNTASLCQLLSFSHVCKHRISLRTSSAVNWPTIQEHILYDLENLLYISCSFLAQCSSPQVPWPVGGRTAGGGGHTFHTGPLLRFQYLNVVIQYLISERDIDFKHDPTNLLNAFYYCPNMQ